MRYQVGQPLDVMVRLNECGDLGASNGSRTGQFVMGLEQLMRLAGSAQGMADPAYLQPAG